MTTDLLDRAKALDAAFGRIRVAQAVLPESRDKDALDAETTEAVLAAEALMSAAGIDPVAAGTKTPPPHDTTAQAHITVQAALEGVAKMLEGGGAIDTGCKELDDTLDQFFESKFCGGYASGEECLIDELEEEWNEIFDGREMGLKLNRFHEFLTTRRPDSRDAAKRLPRDTLYQVVAVDGDIEIGPLYHDQRRAEDEATEESECCRVEEVECAVLRQRTVWETPAPEAEEWRVVFQVRDADTDEYVRDATDARVFDSVQAANAYGTKAVGYARTVTTGTGRALKICGHRVVAQEAMALDLSEFVTKMNVE